MAIIVKCDPEDMDCDGAINVCLWAFRDVRPQAGELAYIWTCHTSGGEHLAGRGEVRTAHRLGRDVELSVEPDGSHPTRPFTYDMLRPWRDRSEDPMAGLARLIVRNAHRKVAELSREEAGLLDSHFDNG